MLRGLLVALMLPGAAAASTATPVDGLPQHIDAPRSQAKFSLRVAWVRTLHGRFDYLEGFVHRLPSRGVFSVDVRLAALSLYMGNPDHAQWAQSEEFFDAARHPWIRFFADDVPDRVLREGGAIQGQLSLRGITRQVVFEVEPTECARPGLDCAVVGRGELKRSDFGMDSRRLVVSDKVKLDLAIRVRDAVQP